MEHLCFLTRFKWVFSKFQLPQVSAQKYLLAGEDGEPSAGHSKLKDYNNEDVQTTTWLTQLSRAEGGVARRQSETFVSSSLCLRWEDVLLCSICFLMSFICCCLQCVRGLMSYFCNPLPEGIKIGWNKQLLHKYKSERASIIQLVCVVNSIASFMARFAELPRPPPPLQLSVTGPYVFQVRVIHPSIHPSCRCLSQLKWHLQWFCSTKTVANGLLVALLWEFMAKA